MDSYLEIARKVLNSARQPLSAREILRAAYRTNVVPRDLYGRTQYKTLHARLSTNILKFRLASDFYRTGPGRFFLRSLRDDRTTPERYRPEYTAPLRATQLGRFDVVALSRSTLNELTFHSQSEISLDDLMSTSWRYARMDEVRRDTRLLPFRLLILVVDEDRIVVTNKLRVSGDEFPGRTTLGVAGVVRREDRTLFSSDNVGLPNAAARTLMRGLDLPRELIRASERVNDFATAGLVI